MKKHTALTFIPALLLACPALAQQSSAPYVSQQTGSDMPVDKSDHFNNQSSIVPDTVPDKVSHTDRGQIKADQAAIHADKEDLNAHQAHEREQMEKSKKDLQVAPHDGNPGRTPPIATQ